MKLFSALKSRFFKHKRAVFSIEEYKQQVATRIGRSQFEKLLQKGLSIPVVLL